MNSWNRHIIAFFVFISLMGCNNENAFDCFKKKGEQIEQRIDLTGISTVRLYDGINLKLGHSNSTYAILRTGANLAPKINFSMDADTLYIQDANSCNWVREYENTTVELFVPSRSLRLVEQFGFGNLSTIEGFEISSFRLNARQSSGDANLNLTGYNLLVVSNGIGKIELSGQVNDLRVGFYDNDAICDASKLLTENVDFTHRGGNKIIVNAQKTLTGEILSYGSTYYISEPDSINVEIRGPGKIEKLNN